MSVTSEEQQISEDSPVEQAAEQKPAKKFARRYGTRFEVFDSETAEMTRGGLKKGDLMMSKSGKIVSKKKSESAKALYEKFGFSKRTVKKPTKKKTRRKKKKTD